MRHARRRTSAFTLSLALLAVASPALAQQRALDHEDVLRWNTIASPSLSPDGAWLVYVLTAMEGDPVLTIRAAREGATPLTVRGSSPAFTSDSRFVVYEVPPVEAVVDSLRREGKRGDALPKDSLGVIALGGVGPEARTVGAMEGHRVAGMGAWVAYVPVVEEEEKRTRRPARVRRRPQRSRRPRPRVGRKARGMTTRMKRRRTRVRRWSC